MLDECLALTTVTSSVKKIHQVIQTFKNRYTMHNFEKAFIEFLQVFIRALEEFSLVNPQVFPLSSWT